jgi:type I restriction enzyme S subunit
MTFDLPEGWKLLTVTELAGLEGIVADGDWIESKDQNPDGGVRLIQLADIGVGEFLNRSARFLTSQKARELQCTMLEAGDLLIAGCLTLLGALVCFLELDSRASQP